MGKYKGKAKALPTAKQIPKKPSEFSDNEEDEDNVFSSSSDEEKREDVLLNAVEDDDDDEDEEQQDEDEPIHWGSKKSNFYKQESSSEDEEDEENDVDDEEAEALRLIKKRQNTLKKEDLDLGLDESDDEEEEEEEEEEVQAPKIMKKKNTTTSKEENDELLASEAPEVLALLEEFSEKSKEIKDSIEPALERLKSSSTKEGISYLETKLHLLLSYTMNVSFYLLYRAENGANKAESHPVVNQLLKLRTLLEKLRPLDLKLKNELDELVHRANTTLTSTSTTEPTQNKNSQKYGFRPELSDLSNGMDDDEEEEEENGEEEHDIEEKSIRKGVNKEEKKRLDRAKKSKLLQEIQGEASDAPVEIGISTKESKKEKQKRKYEEENFTRLPSSSAKKDIQRKSKAELLEHGGDLNTLLKDLDDEEYSKFEDLIDEDGNNVKKSALSMHLNEMEQARKAARKVFRGGDDDVAPKKRTKVVDQKMSSFDGQGDDEHEQQDEEDVVVDEDAEHPFYNESSKKRKQAREDREESYQFPKRYTPKPVKNVEVRSATRQMIKNRGLTPHKSKDARNPRKNMRAKYESKVKARRSQVRDVRTNEGDYYQGEASGIRSNLIRSRQAGKL